MIKGKSFHLEPCLVEMNIESDDRNEVLRLLVGKLQQGKYVDDLFLTKVIERESSFPTGLQFEDIAIAIPHANPENVLGPAAAIGICKNAVEFGNMENPKSRIAVKIIIVLAINDADMHLTVLSRLMSVFQDKTKIEKIISASDNKEICVLFKKYLFN